MTDYIILGLSTIGALFVLIASFGILKMPDFYARLSVTIKAATLGIGCILIAASLHFKDFPITTKALAIIFFIFLTTPVAGFLIGRVAYSTGIQLWKNSIVDEIKNDPDSSAAIEENTDVRTSQEPTSDENEPL